MCGPFRVVIVLKEPWIGGKMFLSGCDGEPVSKDSGITCKMGMVSPHVAMITCVWFSDVREIAMYRFKFNLSYVGLSIKFDKFGKDNAYRAEWWQAPEIDDFVVYLVLCIVYIWIMFRFAKFTYFVETPPLRIHDTN